MCYNTSFINLDNDEKKSVAWRIDKFLEIVKTGIKLCVYVDSIAEEKIQDMVSDYSNVILMKTFCIEDLYAYNVCSKIENLQLPYTNNVKKDTKEYMIVINSKIEFVKKVMEENPFNTDYFAWIDFSITHVFTSNNYINILNDINDTKFKGKVLAIPGCQSKLSDEEENDVNIRNELQSIYWRFCGGFFFGDKNSLEDFYDLYVEYFPIFVKKYKTIVWEVNFWAWLECNSVWTPDWYSADHNDSIIEIPYTLTSISLHSVSEIRKYDYPSIENGLFVPSSASYIRHNGIHILNTRYVNYTIKDERFFFNDSSIFVI